MSIHSLLTFGSSFFDTKMALLSEWLRMFVISVSDESGRMGTEILPKGTNENIATVQFGMFCDNMATLSPELMPYRESLAEISSHLCLKLL